MPTLPDEILTDVPQHVRHITITLATGVDAMLLSLMPVLPARLFRDRVARTIWRNTDRPGLPELEATPITFTLQCANDRALYEVWMNVKGRVYARHYVRRDGKKAP